MTTSKKSAARPKPPAPNKPRPAPKPRLPLCKTIFSYEAGETDELSFEAGETIEIVKEGGFISKAFQLAFQIIGMKEQYIIFAPLLCKASLTLLIR